MKKILILVVLALFVISCTPLKPDGQFGKSEFVGKFKNYTIYKVNTPNGTKLYLAVNENNEVVQTQHIQSNGKSSYSVPVIYINGKKVDKDEALKLLKE